MKQPPRYELIGDRRAIIDRRAIADRLAALPDKGLQKAACAMMGEALAAGREEIARRLAAEPGRGRVIAASYSFLNDQIVRLAHDLVVTRLYPNHNPSKGERLAVVGLGGTGRGEMALHSDLDLMFLIGDHRAPWCEQAAEAMLYLLWDLKLKVGHSVRTPEEVVAAAKTDMTIRTSLLESRWMWGNEQLYAEAGRRYRADVVAGTGRDFVTAKLAERDVRHQRMGDSRYVVEPNVKDGKGGLRDLHTLYWIGKYVFDVEQPSELVDKGLFTAQEFARFERAERFFWSVRCHLHLIAGRAEERLGFDLQKRIAEAMRYTDRPGKSAVERFMHFYFLNAKAVGDLTGVFLAQLDEQLAAKGRRFTLPTLRRRPRRLAGFVLDRGRISIPSDDWFEQDPVRLIELFALAAREGLEVHPAAQRAAARDARLAEKVRDDPRANALFVDTLTAPDKPDLVLRWMNEAGVFGRFIPDFGRVVAQMQFDMYHHYTVDEHSIRAIGLLSRIERGELAEDHPLSTAMFEQIESRRTLYVAVLLHDIAKGRGGDHSELGAEIALQLCPRLGLDEGETETVAWLVRYHLLLSNTAFRRDPADPKTVEDFVGQVQSPERLRLLLILTVVDIRAVGPGTWTEWKRLLIRTLFEAAEERLRLGHKQRGRSEQVAERQDRLARSLDWNRAAMRAHSKRLPDSYWLAEPPEWQEANARQVAEAEARLGDRAASVAVAPDKASGMTRVSIYAPDRPGLFFRIAAALNAAGASIADARIHTTRDGMALDNLLVTDPRGRPYEEAARRRRLAAALEQSLADHHAVTAVELPALARRDQAFAVAPRVLISDKASTRTTVVEVNARDRPGLLARLAQAIHVEGYELHSAHIATYGERAVDVFYLTDGHGRKLDEAAMAGLRAALIAVAAEEPLARAS
jgi:[protein-PII] uridylyltransferase